MKKNRILMPGSFAAALSLVLAGCGSPNPMDSGTDARVIPPGDGGPDMPDAPVPPDTDGGMPMVDAGTDTGGMLVCTAEMKAVRAMGCGEFYDLPSGMPYDDTAMLAACMTTLNGTRWATVGNECDALTFRETGTGHWLLSFGCLGANDPPYGGVFRLGSDGCWYGNYGNADLPGEPGNHGVLCPPADCETMMGEFYDGGATTPRATVNYWMM